jgi:hypothetical protein
LTSTRGFLPFLPRNFETFLKVALKIAQNTNKSPMILIGQVYETVALPLSYIGLSLNGQARLPLEYKIGLRPKAKKAG